MGKKKSDKIILKPWAMAFSEKIIDNFSNSNVPSINYILRHIKNIEIEQGKVTGIYEEKNRRNIIIELVFKISKDQEKLAFSFFKSPGIIEILNDSNVQIEMNRALAIKKINIIPNWHEININCSCKNFDYLMPCRHVIGLFIKLFQEISGNPKILFKIQGIDIDSIQQFIKNIKEPPENILNFEEYSKKYKLDDNINKEIIDIDTNETEEDKIIIDTNISIVKEYEMDEISPLIINENINNDKVKEITESGTNYKSRIGQTEFKGKLLAKYNRCILCNIDMHDLLIASHIKPWSESNNIERLDVNNGLLLCALHDKLFDLGYISFEDDGKIIISKDILKNIYNELKINSEMHIYVSSNMKKYMEYHRKNIYK